MKYIVGLAVFIIAVVAIAHVIYGDRCEARGGVVVAPWTCIKGLN